MADELQRQGTDYLLAAYNGEVSVLVILEKYNANVTATDNYGRSAVHLASKENKSEALIHLLKVGADATVKDNWLRQPLHLASLKGAMETLIILLDHLKCMEIEKPLQCADRNGRTPLHLAAKENWPNIIQYLIENGADPEASDHYERTPMHLADLHGCTRAVEALLKFSDINSLDKFNHTPYYLAVTMNTQKLRSFCWKMELMSMLVHGLRLGLIENDYDRGLTMTSFR